MTSDSILANKFEAFFKFQVESKTTTSMAHNEVSIAFVSQPKFQRISLPISPHLKFNFFFYFWQWDLPHRQGIGITTPLPSMSLSSILYIPNFPFNLISINQLTQSLNCYITFSSDTMVKD